MRGEGECPTFALPSSWECASHLVGGFAAVAAILQLALSKARDAKTHSIGPHRYRKAHANDRRRLSSASPQRTSPMFNRWFSTQPADLDRTSAHLPLSFTQVSRVVPCDGHPVNRSTLAFCHTPAAPVVVIWQRSSPSRTANNTLPSLVFELMTAGLGQKVPLLWPERYGPWAEVVDVFADMPEINDLLRLREVHVDKMFQAAAAIRQRNPTLRRIHPHLGSPGDAFAGPILPACTTPLGNAPRRRACKCPCSSRSAAAD